MKKKFLTVIAVFLALISLSACAKKTNGVEEENKKETAENINFNFYWIFTLVFYPKIHFTSIGLF